MFKAKFSQSLVIRRVVESIKDFVSLTNVDILLAGIQIRCLDQVRIAMVALNLVKEDFDVYEVDCPLVLGINFNHLSTIMKQCWAEDSVTLIVKKDDSQLQIIFENEDSNSTASFKLHLYDIDCDSFEWQEIEGGTVTKMLSMKFAQIMNRFKDFGDSSKQAVNNI